MDYPEYSLRSRIFQIKRAEMKVTISQARRGSTVVCADLRTHAGKTSTLNRYIGG